jgi:hypothetical protein
MIIICPRCQERLITHRYLLDVQWHYFFHHCQLTREGRRCHCGFNAYLDDSSFEEFGQHLDTCPYWQVYFTLTALTNL